jgi:hypothetical protein
VSAVVHDPAALKLRGRCARAGCPGLPEHLRRSLYDAFQLQVRYHRPRHEVTIRVTICADSLNHINGTVNAIRPQGEDGEEDRNPFPCCERPQQDSNLRTRLRRAVLYPLSYGGWRTSLAASEACWPEQEYQDHRTRTRSARITWPEPITSAP